MVDASSMIYAWDNYPINQFPPLWDWMADQVETGQLQMPFVAFDEVNDKTPDCAEWLKENKLQVILPSEAILLEALRIKNLVGIVGDAYHPKGVGENDIMIIATARLHRWPLMSDEGTQAILPKEPAKKKIPAVCGMPGVAVQCGNFLEYLKNSGAIFK